MNRLFYMLAITLTVLLSGSVAAHAQELMGHPFIFTINGDFIDGEPDANYNANGGLVSVSVGASVVYTVRNTDTRQRQAQPYYSLYAWLVDAAGHRYVPTQAPLGVSGSDNIAMKPNQVKTYSLNTSASGPVGAGGYIASANFHIEDLKTGDLFDQGKTKIVTVN